LHDGALEDRTFDLNGRLGNRLRAGVTGLAASGFTRYSGEVVPWQETVSEFGSNAETDSFQFHQTRVSRCGASGGGSPELRRATALRLQYCFIRSNSHAAKHRTGTWNLSSPGLSPSRANWISNSSSFFVTGFSQTAHAAPTPGPPHVRSGLRAGSLPFLMVCLACSRRRASSGMGWHPCGLFR